MEQNNGDNVIAIDFEKTDEERERYKDQIFKRVLARVDEYLISAAMNFDISADLAAPGDDLVIDVIEIVAPGFQAFERNYAMHDTPFREDDLLCIQDIRLQVGFVLGSLLAGRVLDGRSPEKWGSYTELLAEKLMHVYDCHDCNKRKGANHGNQ